MNAFFAQLFRLRLIQRWNLMRSVMPENVAEHSYHVAVLTHALCTIATEITVKKSRWNGQSPWLFFMMSRR